MALHLQPIPDGIEFVDSRPAGIIIKGKFHKCCNGAVAVLRQLFVRQGTFLSIADISASTHIKRVNVAPYLHIGRQILAEHAKLSIYTHKGLGYMMQKAK